jgi:membrane associated rhomboid family serine protease
MLFPTARVTTLIPIFVFITIRELPAVFILGLWFVLQLFSGVGSLSLAGQEQAGGVAYFAHIGGFVLGLVLIRIMAPSRRPPSPRGRVYEFR